ncbi:MAG: alpha/beta fold hydrolase [Chloroflexota bacterium]|jgi:pimeloyl-ACP methyl ester carboxylesterase
MVFEQEISFSSNGLTLAGTVTLPEKQGAFPGVVLVPGSGQVDRNENAKKLAINAFREIAADLAAKGIASLRYDKRGVAKSQGDFWETGFYDNVADALAALRFFKAYEHIRPEEIFVLGHSEGALIATRLAATGADIKGVILLSGTAQSGEDTLLWQGKQVLKGMRGLNGFLIRTLHIDAQKAQRKQLEKIKRSTKDWYRVQLVAKVNAKWMREFLTYNPADDLPKIQAPVLAITGSKDIQVNPSDLEKMAELVNSDFESHEVPDVTHILRKEAGEPTLSTYRQQVQQPVDERVLNIISDWLKRHVELMQPQDATDRQPLPA